MSFHSSSSTTADIRLHCHSCLAELAFPGILWFFAAFLTVVYEEGTTARLPTCENRRRFLCEKTLWKSSSGPKSALVQP